MAKTAQSDAVMTVAVPSLQGPSGNEETFRKLVEALPDAVLVHRGNRIVFVNPVCVRLHRAETADQLLGRDISEFIRPDCLPEIQQRVQECQRTRVATVPLESVLIACDGSSVDIEAVAVPISWNGEPAIEVVMRDIRNRKRAEGAVLEWHKRLELAQKSGLRIGLWDWDVDTNSVVWSEETYRQWGYTRETFSGRVEDAVCRIHLEDQPRVKEAINRVLVGRADEYEAQYRVVWPDGSVCWIDAHGVMLRNGSTHMIGIGVDITGLKQAELSIKEEENKYRTLFENATYGICLTRLDGSLLDANPALVAMLGYTSKEDLLAQNVERDIYEDPAVRKAVLAKIGSDARIRGAEARWRRKDGKVITVRLGGGPIIANDGSLSHLEIMVEDITERRNLEEQYRQSQKLEAVGLLAGGISHDFNNLLGIILGNADLLMDKTATGSQQQHHVEAIKKAGGSAAQLVRQLLAFSRKQVLYPAVMDMNAVVSDVGKILHRLIGEDVRVTIDLQAGLGSILADRGQIEQILMNLATNSRDAMPNGGAFTIRTQNAELGDEDVARYPYVKRGKYVHLSVTDTGSGMSEEVSARVFEPFFTTKEKGRGTGLGLSTVYGIVKQSGGYVWVRSGLGKGTTFDVYLPRIDQRARREAPASSVQTEYPRGTETVLLLEDEGCLRRVTREFLTESGYKVLDAGRGDQAVDLAIQYKEPISLIISDVVMPEMSGPAAVAKLRALHPEARVLYVSGYAEVPVAQQLISEGAIVMQKPVLRIDLLRRVDEMLHVPPGAAPEQ